MNRWFRCLAAFAVLTTGLAMAADGAGGQLTYDAVCRVCHGSGIAGSPKLGDRAAWSTRMQRGIPALYSTAISGKGAMPPRGGRLNLSDDDVKAAVDFMLRASVGQVVGVASAESARGTARPQSRSDEAKSTAPGSRSGRPASSAAVASAAVSGPSGAPIYQRTCSVCHASGLAGAPRVGDAAAWRARLKGGVATLYASAINGKLAMPARGGNAQLSDTDVRAAVDVMLKRSGVGSAAPAIPAVTATPTVAPARPPDPASQTSAAVATSNVSAAPPPGTSSTETIAAAPPRVVTAAGDPNAFNRLLRPTGGRNLPPASDGIHDPDNDGTHMLQAPQQALAALPKRNSLGDIDWVRALAVGGITPRADLSDPTAQMVVLDMNIVRAVKGSMPDVVYPHDAHTRLLDCSNCHPAIFVPQKGANQISMAAIMLGQKCGVCHGSVAFPVSECRRCHSQDKPNTPVTKP